MENQTLPMCIRCEAALEMPVTGYCIRQASFHLDVYLCDDCHSRMLKNWKTSQIEVTIGGEVLRDWLSCEVGEHEDDEE